jgi:hypothetical protein
MPKSQNGENKANMERGIIKNVNHFKKICLVCERHFISVNFPPKNLEGCYAYSSSRVKGNYVCKNPLTIKK